MTLRGKSPYLTAPTPSLGAIEGFYGRAWPEASRLSMPRWLRMLGLDAYLYAPKSDYHLRRGWREPWPAARRQHLASVARAAEAQELGFHLGLSPFALYEAYDRPARRALSSKLAEIVDLGVTGFALLFDDMPGGCDSLAERQAEICSDIHVFLADSKLALSVCPTYYSDDPVLDKVFGERPEGYLQSLSELLEPDWQLFWTGTEVCAASIDVDSLQAASEASGGRLALWDNYPVNDSRSRSEHLYLAPLPGRSPEIAGMIRSHWCNAMNQPALSLPALASLPSLYGNTPGEEPAAALAEAGIDEPLIRACLPLAVSGRGELAQPRREHLQELAEGNGLAARELAGWLRGDYEFDPACLTD